jgi:hypothetical protein
MVQLGLRDDEISVGLANKIVSLDCQLLCCSVVVGLYAVGVWDMVILGI